MTFRLTRRQDGYVVLTFGAFSLDPGRFELRGPSGLVHVEPQVFDVLVHLITHRDRVVTREELLETVWGSRFVSDSTLTSRIKAARRAVDDDGERQSVITTVRGRGFRFVAPVLVDGDPAPEPGPPEAMTAAAVGAVRTRAARPGRGIPRFLTPLVGRDADVAAVARALAGHRLVTVLGPGGVGKTRCAVAAAAAAGDDLALDVAFVDLVPVEDPSAVTRAAAEALGTPLAAEGSGIAGGLTTALADRPFLVVLDNAEHLLDAVVELIGELLRWPGVRILVTSRVRLRLRGERVYPLEPLPLRPAPVEHGSIELPGGPGHRPSPAVDLFELAAQRLDPSFVVDEGNEEAVEALCRTVDGLPLGIELVAAHVRLLSPAALLRQLGDRVATLSEGTRDGPARQRTMQHTLDWSLRLLDATERSMMTRMAVCRAGTDIDGVATIALPGLDLDPVTAIATLVDKSLLKPIPDLSGSVRYGMLSLVHAHLADDLSRSPDARPTRRRHATFHHDYVRDVERRRWNDLADVWVALLSERYADIEAALRYGFSEGDPAEAASTVASLYGYWHRDARLRDGDGWTAQALAYEQDLGLVDRSGLHLGAGYLGFWRHRLAEARKHWERAAELAAEAGADRYQVLGMVDAAGTWMGQPDHADTAIVQCRRGVALSRQIGDRPLISHAVNVLGELYRLAGDTEAAVACNREGLDLARDLGDQLHQAIFELNLSVLAITDGRVEEAADLATAALRRAAVLRRQTLVANALVIVAGVRVAEGRGVAGARLLGAADGAMTTLGLRLGPGDQPDHDAFRERGEALLGTESWRRHSADGSALGLTDAVTEALAADVEDRRGT